jgi:CubicO group peptidase (beta-lactamase class C family)
MRLRFALLAFVALTPALWADAEWPTADPAEVGLNPAPLEELATLIESDDSINIHSVLVVKDGQLVFERYFSGTDQDWGEDLGVVEYDASKRHDLRSVSKSVTSALVGIAIGEGRLPGIEADVFELFPGQHDRLAPEKQRLKLKHILAMSAGLDWFEPSDYTNPGNDEIRMINSPDPVAFVLGRAFVTEPGAVFEYNGGLPTLLGYLLEQAYGQPGDMILQQKLLAPLGIESFDFRANDSGLLAYASGIRLRPRDMAKIGQLYLDDGRWQGQQLIPADWVAASLSPQVLDAGWAWGYGYQWWIGRLEVDGETWDLPMAVGNGNQRILIVKPLNLVMVTTAGHYNQSEGVLWGQQLLMRYVLPAAGKKDIRWVAPE